MQGKGEIAIPGNFPALAKRFPGTVLFALPGNFRIVILELLFFDFKEIEEILQAKGGAFRRPAAFELVVFSYILLAPTTPSGSAEKA